MPKTARFKAADLTDQQVRDLLAGALGSKMKADSSCFIQDVNREKGYFTYQEYDYYGTDGPELYKCSFAIGDDYTVTLGTATRVIQTARYEPAPGQDEDDEAGMSAFSLDDTAASTVAVDGFVERTGKVSETGDYPDKGIEFSEEDFDAATSAFAPVPMDVEHTDSVLDGNLGELTQVWRKGKELFGKFRVPSWLQSHFTKNGILPKVSLTWDKASKRIVKCAWVLNPRVEDAVLMAAFASTQEGSKPADAPPVSAPLSPPSPDAARKAKPMNPIKELWDKLAAFVNQEAAKVGTEEPAGTPPAGTPPPQEKPVTTPAPAATPPAAPPVADMSKDPQYIAMSKRLAEMEAVNLRSDAERWAEGEIQESRALPKDKERMVAAFCRAAQDDKAAPATINFSNADGSAATGSRVDALKADYAARPRHLLTGEFMPDGTEAFAIPTRVKMSDEDEAMSLLERTPMGQTALKKIKAGDIPDPTATKNGKGKGN